MTEQSYTIDPGTDIGHVHLKVSDLDRAVAFYRDALGFELSTTYPGAAFMSAGGYHHHVGLNVWQSEGDSPPPPRSTGLFHFAIRYPTRAALAAALRRLVDQGVTIGGASDHGVSEAIYLADPDGNGIELYWDRPKREWPQTEEGSLDMYTKPLDVQGLLAAAD
jgi:catechol 2,3-dioxygenase